MPKCVDQMNLAPKQEAPGLAKAATANHPNIIIVHLEKTIL